MAKLQDSVFCDGCGIEVTWTPYYREPTHNQLGIRQRVRRGEYCCQDCAQGYKCSCGERMLLEDDRRKEPAQTYTTDTERFF